MSATGALSAWDRIISWTGGLSSAADAVLTPIVSPLADLFDSVTGDSATVRATAQRWRDLAIAVNGLNDCHRDVVSALRSDWSGEAAEAFSTRMSEFGQAVDKFAAELEATGEFLDDAAMEVEVAEQLVETIIRELIEMIILTVVAGLALSWLSAGLSAAASALASAAEGAIAYARVAAIVARVATALQEVAVLLRTSWLIKTATTVLVVKPALQVLTGVTASPVGESLNVLRDGALGILADEFDDQRSGDTTVQTPLRSVVDDVVAPVAEGLDPFLDEVDPVIDPVIDAAEGIPQRPLS